jgi:hypothetical protein
MVSCFPLALLEDVKSEAGSKDRDDARASSDAECKVQCAREAQYDSTSWRSLSSSYADCFLLGCGGLV